MSEMNIFLLQESKKIQDFVEANRQAMEDRFFSQD